MKPGLNDSDDRAAPSPEPSVGRWRISFAGIRASRSGFALLVVCALALTLSSTAFAHPDGGHVAIGQGTSKARQTLRLEASETELHRGRFGTAWFTPRGRATVEITLSCVEVEWRGATYMPYFIPAGGQAHDLFASGKGDDGRRYRLHLWASPGDRGLLAGFTLRSGRAGHRPCGAPGRVTMLRRGLFAIAP